MSFNTALVIIIAIVSITVLGLAAMGTYKEYLTYKRREEKLERERQARERSAKNEE